MTMYYRDTKSNSHGKKSLTKTICVLNNLQISLSSDPQIKFITILYIGNAVSTQDNKTTIFCKWHHPEKFYDLVKPIASRLK